MLTRESVSYCRECGKEVQENWITCPYCSCDLGSSQQNKVTVNDSVVMGNVAINDVTRCVNCESTGVTIIACSLCKENCYCSVCANEVRQERKATLSETIFRFNHLTGKGERISTFWSERLCNACFQNRRDELCNSNCDNCGVYYHDNSIIVRSEREDSQRKVGLCSQCSNLWTNLTDEINQINHWVEVEKSKFNPSEKRWYSSVKHYEDTKQKIERYSNQIITKGKQRNPHISKFNEQRQKQFIEEMNKQINEIKSISTIQKEHRRRTAEKERKHKEIQAKKERKKKEGRFIVLKEESIRYKKTWKSIGIGLLLILPINVLLLLFPERVDSHDLYEFSIINIFAWIWIIAVDTACCFYPLYLGLVLAYDKEELEKLDRELNPKSESKKDWDKEPQVMLVGESKERRRFGYRLTSSLKTNHARPVSIKIIQEGFKLEYEINSISDAQSGKLRLLMKDRIIGALTLGVRGKHTAHIEVDGDAYFLFVTFKGWSFEHGVKRLSLARVNGDEEIIADLDT